MLILRGSSGVGRARALCQVARESDGLRCRAFFGMDDNDFRAKNQLKS